MQPDWEAAGFEVRGGPNQSSQMSIINGQSKSSVTYSYYVEPRDTGTYYIPSVSIVNGEKEYKTEALKISVFPNPNKIIETPQRKMHSNPFWDDQPESQPEPSIKPRKKRNPTKI